LGWAIFLHRADVHDRPGPRRRRRSRGQTPQFLRFAEGGKENGGGKLEAAIVT